MRKRLALAAALGLAGGCTHGHEPDPAPQFLITPVSIERVEVHVSDGVPAQVTAHVEDVLGDGCSELNSERQVRNGNTVTLTVLAQRPPNAICSQIARLYRKDLPLVGDFPPGPYTLSVNGVERAFAVP